MRNLALEIVLPFREVSASDVWERLLGSHPKDFRQLATANLYEMKLAIDAIGKVLRTRERDSFNISWGPGVGVAYSHIANHSLSFARIESCISSVNDAENWVAPFLDQVLVQARLFDSDYERWQNAQDPAEYRAARRSLNGKLLISNGLPPPLEQLVVDISGNPGRRVLRQGFIEAIGSPMWLGPGFWNVSGASRDQVLSESWLRGSDLSSGVVRIQPSNFPFDSVDPESALLQDRIRALLYPG